MVSAGRANWTLELLLRVDPWGPGGLDRRTSGTTGTRRCDRVGPHYPRPGRPHLSHLTLQTPQTLPNRSPPPRGAPFVLLNAEHFFFLFSSRRVTVREPRRGRARCSPTPRFPSGDLGGLGAEPGRLPRPSKAAREGGGPLGARPRPWAPHQDPAASRSDRHRARVRPGARREP